MNRLLSRLLSPFSGLLLAVASLVPLRAADTPARVAGFTYVKTVGGIANYTLDANGLDVLLLPDHSAPVLTLLLTPKKLHL